MMIIRKRPSDKATAASDIKEALEVRQGFVLVATLDLLRCHAACHAARSQCGLLNVEQQTPKFLANLSKNEHRFGFRYR